MRVAFVTHYGDYQYGANRSLVDLIDGLQAFGLEMLVIAPRAGSLVSGLERRGITVICHHCGWWMSPGGSKLCASARMLRGALSAPILVCSKVEAMGRVTAEAMAAGKPVISYTNEGALELIEHEVKGLLYSSGAEELANCMLRLMEDQSLLRRISLVGWGRGKLS